MRKDYAWSLSKIQYEWPISPAQHECGPLATIMPHSDGGGGRAKACGGDWAAGADWAHNFSRFCCLVIVINLNLLKQTVKRVVVVLLAHPERLS